MDLAARKTRWGCSGRRSSRAAIRISGRTIFFDGLPVTERRPEDLSEAEIRELERTHGWQIKRP
jgi:hypothetical protein